MNITDNITKVKNIGNLANPLANADIFIYNPLCKLQILTSFYILNVEIEYAEA